MFSQCWRYTLAGCLLSPLCAADGFHIDPQADSFYQQAVPYLQKANSKFEAVTAITPGTSAEEKRRSLDSAAEAGETLKPAIPLLEQAAALDHPVAQYRLGLIYVLLEPNDVTREKACSLFERSLGRGFAPPALEIASFCPAYTDTPEYKLALQVVETSMPRYERYFPQPASLLECKRETPPGLGMQWGSSRDFQAEIYRLQGDGNRARRAEYYRKALDLNDCYKAKKRLAIMAS
ncbi:hypothetical protein V0R50_26525 [Pseudomonas sp. 148P]|uniref:Sel1 repeat family protein n=1 Tax=Pseudomonas ulcerans TaxID=3115852 RepID=A0ABU7HZ77_9PSED|nr:MULTISPECIES: hypothetical protein [unclassified Pseudomonas]MEE1925340.1 hypothetical protein [Pseudomonas sp. 147P]MEE1936794.1 hypothetical protein [Pseudomonas sp. 148P]